MKRAGLFFGLFLSALLVLAPAAPGFGGDWTVYFSPKGGCTEAVVKEVGGAHKSIQVQAYSFTSYPITKALVEAHARKVKVEVILDKSGNLTKELTPNQHTSLNALLIAKIPTWIDTKHQIAHNKIMIIDGNTVITGSFNFTKNAEEDNAENLLIIKDKALAQLYEANWLKHQAHAKPYEEIKPAGARPGR